MCDTDSNGDSSSNSGAIAAGIILSILASIAGNFGVNFQKYGFTLEAKKPLSERRPYIKQWRWWIGMIMVVLGALGDFASFALAPQSIVTPVGSMTLVANLGFAHFWLKERLTRRDLFGTGLIVLGASLTVAFGSHASPCFTLDKLVNRYKAYIVWIYFAGCFALGAFYYQTLRLATRILIQHIQKASRLLIQHFGSLDETAIQKQPKESLLTMRAFSEPVVENRDTSSHQEIADIRLIVTNEKQEIEDQSPKSTGPLTASSSHREQIQTRRRLSTLDMIKERVEKNDKVDINEITAAISDPPPEYSRYIRLHPLAYAGLAGVMGGQNTLFAKTVAEILSTTFQGNNQLVEPLTYVFVVALVLSIVFQQHFLAGGLQFFDALYIVPVFQAHFIIISVISGGVNFKEFDGFTTTSWIFFPIGVLLVVVGVMFLSERKMGQSSENNECKSPTMLERNATVSAPGELSSEIQRIEVKHVSGVAETEHDDKTPLSAKNMRETNHSHVTRPYAHTCVNDFTSSVDSLSVRPRANTSISHRQSILATIPGLKPWFAPNSNILRQDWVNNMLISMADRSGEVGLGEDQLDTYANDMDVDIESGASDVENDNSLSRKNHSNEQSNTRREMRHYSLAEHTDSIPERHEPILVESEGKSEGKSEGLRHLNTILTHTALRSHESLDQHSSQPIRRLSVIPFIQSDEYNPFRSLYGREVSSTTTSNAPGDTVGANQTENLIVRMTSNTGVCNAQSAESSSTERLQHRPSVAEYLGRGLMALNRTTYYNSFLAGDIKTPSSPRLNHVISAPPPPPRPARSATQSSRLQNELTQCVDIIESSEEDSEDNHEL